MLLEHNGERPKVHLTAYIAPNATLCGDVTVSKDSRVMFGAVLTAEGGPVRIGDTCVVMENAVIRGTKRHPTSIGDNCVVGPRAHLVGCQVGDNAFLATGSTSFNYLSHPKSTYIASAIEGAYAQSAIGPYSREGEVRMPTITVEKSVTIDRPADQVWRFLSDENSAIKWQQSLHSHRTEGNSAHQVRKFGGHQMEMHHEVENDHQGRIRSFQGQIDTNVGVHEYEGQFTVTPAGDSASIVDISVVWHLVHLSAEGAQAMENILDPAIEGDVMTLKNLLEAPPEFHQHLQQAHPVWESSS
jgi:uncharacterized membrane protein